MSTRTGHQSPCQRSFLVYAYKASVGFTNTGGDFAFKQPPVYIPNLGLQWICPPAKHPPLFGTAAKETSIACAEELEGPVAESCGGEIGQYTVASRDHECVSG